MGQKANAKDWKAVTMDWTALQDYDHSEQLGICLTQREVAILKALLTTAYWSTRWTNLTATPDELDEFVSNLDSQLDGNDCGVCNMEFRDNPLDPCEVQYSTDGGGTWTTMFRKDICHAAPTSVDIDNIYTDITNIETNNTTWAGDITNVAPDWAYVDADSDKALCWAISFYVDMVCDTAIAQIKSENQNNRDMNSWLDDLSDMLGAGVVAAIAFFSSNPITLPMVAMTAIAWATTQVVDEIWDWLVTRDYSDFEDEDARQAIKCVMYQAMEGATPQYANWQSSVDFFSSFGGAYQSIAGAVHKMNQSVDVYINYMLMMEELNDISSTLPVCPCPARWEHTWDFVTHGKEYWDLLGNGYGQWTDGVGFEGQLIVGGGGETSNIIQNLKLDETVPRCDKWSFYSVRDRGAWDSNVTSMEMYNPPRATDSQNSGWFITGENWWDNTFAIDNLDSVALFIRSCWTLGVDYGSVKITKVKLEGEGVDPFLGRDTS